MSIKYVAVGPMKGKTFKIPGPLQVVDGTVDVPDGLHERYGHVLMADWGVCPAHLVQEEPAEPAAIEYPKPEMIVQDAVVLPIEHPTPKSGTGRRK